MRKRASKPGDEHDLIDVGLVVLLFEALPLSEAATPSRTAKRTRARTTAR